MIDAELTKAGITYVGALGNANHETPAAIIDAKRAGRTKRSASFPRMTSSAKSAPPKGTPYAAPIPAPAPQATNSRRCSSDKRPLSEKKLANTAPACFGAPSRPSDTPRPTMITESTALASVRKAGIRPAWNQIATGTHHKRWQLRTERARFGSIIKLAFRS